MFAAVAITAAVAVAGWISFARCAFGGACFGGFYNDYLPGLMDGNGEDLLPWLAPVSWLLLNLAGQTGTNERVEEQERTDEDDIWRVRHYSKDIRGIMRAGVIRSGNDLPSLGVFVEYPPEMPRTAEVLEVRHFLFTSRRNLLDRVVEFNVNKSIWDIQIDTAFRSLGRA
jgi:hypothetical protein